MATLLDTLLEAERRGLPIPEDKQFLLEEARKRNIIEPLHFDEPRKEVEPKLKPFLKEAAKPENIGGTIGGFIGKSAVGRAVGAGIGGMVGEAGEQIGEQIAEETARPKTAGEAAGRIGLAGARQFGFQLGGEAASAFIGKAIIPFRPDRIFAKTVTPEAKIAEETLERFMPLKESTLKKIPLLRAGAIKEQRFPGTLAAEATDDRTLDILQNVAESSIIGGKSIADYKLLRIKAVEDMTNDFINKFGRLATSDELAGLFNEVISDRVSVNKAVATVFYNTAEELSGNPMIPTASLKKFAEPLAKVAKALGGIDAEVAGDDVVSAILKMPDEIPYNYMVDLKSRLFSIKSRLESSIATRKAPAIGKTRKLIGLADQAIESVLTPINKDALEVFREGNKLVKSRIKVYENQLIKSIIKKAVDNEEPEIIISKIFKPRAISNIRKIKTAVDAPTWTKFKGAYIMDTLDKASPGGEFNSKAFFNSLFGRTGMGDKALKEILTPEEFVSLKNVATTLNIVGAKQAEGTGKIFIQLSQAGAIFGLASGTPVKKASAMLLFAPAVLGRLFTSPRASRLFKEISKMPTGSPQAIAALGRLSKIALDIETEMRRTRDIVPTTEEIQGLRGQEVNQPFGR
jgi:hypothetical protein